MRGRHGSAYFGRFISGRIDVREIRQKADRLWRSTKTNVARPEGAGRFCPARLSGGSRGSVDLGRVYLVVIESEEEKYRVR